MRNKLTITLDARIGVRRKKFIIEHHDPNTHIMQKLLDVKKLMDDADMCHVYDIILSVDLHKDHNKTADYLHLWLKEGIRGYMRYFLRDPYRQTELKANCCDVADFDFRQVEDVKLFAGDFSSDKHVVHRQHPTNLKGMNEWLRTLLLANRRSSYTLNFLHVYARLHTNMQVKLFCACLKTIVDLWK